MELPFTPEQERQFRDQLAKVGVSPSCPLCDSPHWTMQLHGMIHIERVCTTCGHVLHFDPKPFDWYLGWTFDLVGPNGQHKTFGLKRQD